MSSQQLQAKVKEGFQTSAYRGATGSIDAIQGDETVSHDGLRFAQMISKKLEPFPMRKHNHLQHQSNFSASVTNNKTHTLRDAIPVPTQPSEVSCDGVVPSGLRDSRGFLETLSSNQRMKGAFDQGVMDAYQRGVDAEGALETQRAGIVQAPLSTNAPNPWKKSTYDHANFSKVDEDSYRPGYRSRHNLVAESDVHRKQVHEQITKGNSVDRDALTEHLKTVHQQTMPRGYQAPSGSKWQTTTNATFSKFDLNSATNANTKFATAPLQKEGLDEVPLLGRRLGEHSTEASGAFSWRGPADQDVKFRHHGSLDIINGVYTMSSQYHHPRADVCTGASYRPSEIVQGQYVTSSKLSAPAKN